MAEYWRAPDDYRKDPDYEPVPPFDFCEDCGGSIHEGDEYYDVPVGRGYMRLCRGCVKNWIKEFMSIA